jgi:hypothetical protein
MDVQQLWKYFRGRGDRGADSISGARAPDGTHWIATALRASQ